LLLAVGTAPVYAAAPAVFVSDVQPVDGGGVVLVERTEGEFDGDPDGWRMNMDVWLRNSMQWGVVLERVVIRYDGGSDPGDSIIDVSLLTSITDRGVILEDEDNGIAANEIPGLDTRVASVPEQRVHALPVADEVTVDLYFEGYDDPISFTRQLVEYASAYPLGSYAFPGALKDLASGEYWYLGDGHTYGSHHRAATAQRFAEDWGIARWDGDDWNLLVDSGDFGNNEDYLIWDRPIYAIADGQVVRCGNGFMDNPDPPEILDGVTDDPPTIPGGGNHLWIRHVSGERVLYAHFHQGTIPTSLCPDDPSLGEHDVAFGAFVKAGEYLGRAGNSGSSSGPHLHIHSEASSQGIPLYYHNLRSFGENDYDPDTDPAPPFNDVEGAAISSHDAFPDFGVFARPNRRANVGVTKSTQPYPAVAGNSVTSTIEIVNHGPDAATGLESVDVLPADFLYDSDTGGCVESPAGTLTCDDGTLQQLGPTGQEDSTSFEITAGIPADLVFDNGGPVLTDNVVSISGNRFDDSAVDDSFSDPLLVVAQADLSVVSLQVVSSPPDALIGEDAAVQVSAVVTSDGPSSPMHARVDWSGDSNGVDATPSPSDVLVPALADGVQRTVMGTFTLSCNEPGQHTVEIEAEIEPDSVDDVDPDASNNGATTSFSVECVVPVAINIKPRGFPNSIRYNKGLVPFAILTTEAGEYDLPLAFDALTVDALSVRFGEPTLVWNGLGGGMERHGKGHVEDSYELDEWTRDGDLDLVTDAPSADTGLTPASTEACAKGDFGVNGNTYTFFGCDSVNMVTGGD
jgi:uncharacterized repeat protein (TIGR01451 family)